MAKARRVDANQTEIVEALRAIGASVFLLHAVGCGCPDLLVGFRGANYLLEIKADRYAKLTPAEHRFFDSWNGYASIVRTVDEALEEIGAILQD
ncbi:unnamed protein product [marine sediment metagenome]|uniref:VRR-NUC domain-containing protein n=1 Tax=marine sediment metagenome TaxID=412755 RepID=X0WD15_9ZZZZ